MDRQIESTPAFLPEALWDSHVENFLETELTIGNHHKAGQGVSIYILDDAEEHSSILQHTMGDRISNATLVPIKVFWRDKPTMLSDILAGISDIIERHRASGEKFGIINCSWVVPKDRDVEHALSLAMEAGLLVIAAAGNGGHDTENLSPASMEGAITIGGYDHKTGRKLASSNIGSAIDFWMPTAGCGTSAATAIMSGLVANYISVKIAENAEYFTLSELREIILAQDIHRYDFPVFPNLVDDRDSFIFRSQDIIGVYHEGDQISQRLFSERTDFSVTALPDGIELRNGLLTGTIGPVNESNIFGFLVKIGAASAYYEIILLAAEQSIDDLSSATGEEFVIKSFTDRMIHYTLSVKDSEFIP